MPLPFGLGAGGGGHGHRPGPFPVVKQPRLRRGATAELRTREKWVLGGVPMVTASTWSSQLTSAALCAVAEKGMRILRATASARSVW
jgi:hypothetical protein